MHLLHEMGIRSELDPLHHVTAVRAVDGKNVEREATVAWPAHPDHPPYGLVVRRRTFDGMVAHHAASAGAVLLEGHEAIEPILERGFVRGARVRSAAGVHDIRATYLVVADGANSRFGRAVGTFRRPDVPYAIGARSYWRTDRHAEQTVEAVLGLEDRNGNALPGYGWVFPLGDGTVNVGIGLLSTARDIKSINPTHLLDAFVGDIARRWGIDPGRQLDKASTNRIPMGASIDPQAGPTFLVIGDAAASANPLSGEGIGMAYETGRLAAEVLHDALDAGDSAELQRYPRLLRERHAEYQRTARVVARVLGRPAGARQLTGAVLRSRRLLEATLRIETASLRPGGRGFAEATYRALATIARLTPGA